MSRLNRAFLLGSSLLKDIRTCINRLGQAAMVQVTEIPVWQDQWRALTTSREVGWSVRHYLCQLPKYNGLMQQLFIIFITVFLAELGDKTQLATVLFAADKQQSPYFVFIAAAMALVASTAIAVVLGTAAEKYLTMIPLKLIAGIGFILIGSWTVWSHFQPS